MPPGTDAFRGVFRLFCAAHAHGAFMPGGGLARDIASKPQEWNTGPMPQTNFDAIFTRVSTSGAVIEVPGALLEIAISGTTGTSAPVTTANPLPVSLGNAVALAAGTAAIGGVSLRDGSNPANAATIAAFHNADNQAIAGTGYGLLTGGVAQLLNSSGYLDRARETGFDGIPATGVATGTQQTHQAYATTLAQSVTASGSAQTVSLAMVSFTARGATPTIAAGAQLLVDSGANQEAVFVTAVNTAAKTITAIFAKSHASLAPVLGSAYNQAKDATLGDGVSGAGISAEINYLWDPVSASYSAGRAATADAVPPATIPAEATMVFNGSGFDRVTGSAARGMDVNIRASQPVCTITETSASVGTNSTMLVAAGAATKRLEVFNISQTGTLWVSFQGTAVAGQGYPILPLSGYLWVSGSIPQNALMAISSSGTIATTIWAGN